MDRKKFIDQKIEIEHSEAKDLNAKLTSSLLPGGAKAYDLFTALVQPLHIQRKQEWLNLLMNDLVRREKDGLTTLKDLSKNEEFITIITKATIIAQQNHQQEKLQALRNLLINASEKLTENVNEFDELEYWLTLIERMNPNHIFLLKLFSKPNDFAKDRKDNLNHELIINSKKLIDKLYPELKNKMEMISQYWRDLSAYGLINGDEITIGRHTKRKFQKLTTKLGDTFLEMIEIQK